MTVIHRQDVESMMKKHWKCKLNQRYFPNVEATLILRCQSHQSYFKADQL